MIQIHKLAHHYRLVAGGRRDAGGRTRLGWSDRLAPLLRAAGVGPDDPRWPLFGGSRGEVNFTLGRAATA